MSRVVVSSAGEEQHTARRRLRDRLLWICPLASLVLAAGILWAFGLTLWTAIVAALLIGCPLAVAWALVTERITKQDSSRTAQ
jgi:membrane protein implicated in regulation of membrane protease activity